MTPEERKKRQQEQQKSQYAPVTGIVNPIPSTPSDIKATQAGVVEQGGQQKTEHSGYNQTNTQSNATTEYESVRTGVKPTFVSTPTINAQQDSVLRSIGKQRQDRLATLQNTLQSAADRERRMLKYSAWSDFLTSLGNVAGVGRAIPIQPDNTRTLESFKRMQDIYDAADSINEDPTLTWLDRERLNRQAVIEATNLQAKANDAALQNQFEMAMAKETGVKRTSKSSNESSSEGVNRGSSYDTNYSKSVKVEGLTTDGEEIEALKMSKDKPFTYWGQSSGRPADILIKADEAKTRAIVRDVLGAERNGYESTIMPGANIEAISKAIDEAGIKGLMIQIKENPESYDNSLADVASIIEKADTTGIYVKWLSGEVDNDYSKNIDF